MDEANGRAQRAGRAVGALALAACVALAGCAAQGPARVPAPPSAAPEKSGPSLEQRMRELQQAEALYLSGRYAEAQAAYEQLAKTYPQNPEVWFRLGNTYMKEGHFDDAGTAFQNALATDPGHGRAALNLALARLAQAQAAAATARAHLPDGSAELQQATVIEQRLGALLSEPAR